MRLLFILLLLSNLCFAQDEVHYSERYITSAGDTIKPGTIIKLGSQRKYKYIRPNSYDPVKGDISARALMDKRIFLYTFLHETEHKVSRLSRFRNKKKDPYTYMLAISVFDKGLDPLNPVEYVIETEAALADGEIEIVK